MTRLHLSASASVAAAPDLLVADLLARASSTAPAAAQRQVDVLVARAMQQAHAAKGVLALALDYSVEPSDAKPPGWTAEQTIELRSGDGAALLALVGHLQAQGLAVSSLGWRLSEPARRRAAAEATRLALRDLQNRARDAAATLGLRVDRLEDVWLGGGSPLQPRRGPMMMAARAAPPPEETAAPAEISADVSAELLLRP